MIPVITHTKENANEEELLTLLHENGFAVVEKDPKYIVSFGGDGTFLQAEQLYPSIPKIILRSSKICKKCSPFSNDIVLQKVKNGAFVEEPIFKIEATCNGITMTGINDVTIHNKDPRRGIRYQFRVNNRSWSHEIVGDGVVVATPFGSTGYYKSITDSFFETGIGVAFNNSTEAISHLVLSEVDTVEVQITRGPGLLYSDNNEEIMSLQEGDLITIRKSKERSSYLVVTDLDTK